MKRKKLHTITQGAIIAALYILFTYISSLLGIASGAVQLRLSEALCVMACFTPAAIPGLFIGCLLSGVLTGSVLWDILFGSLATLLGAVGTWFMRNRPYLSVCPPILANALILPPILKYAYGLEGGLEYFAATVVVGEIVSCGILGILLYRTIYPYRKRLGFD